MKCKFYQYKNENGGITIAAVSRYGGKVVKGLAKCSPDDEFDEEKGKALAQARCELKIAEKRNKKASKQYLEAVVTLEQATKKFADMKQYYMDTIDQIDAAIERINDLRAN